MVLINSLIILQITNRPHIHVQATNHTSTFIIIQLWEISHRRIKKTDIINTLELKEGLQSCNKESQHQWSFPREIPLRFSTMEIVQARLRRRREQSNPQTSSAVYVAGPHKNPETTPTTQSSQSSHLPTPNSTKLYQPQNYELKLRR